MADRLGKQIVTERARPNVGHCHYCGAPCTGHTCRAHSDLPQKEPHRTLDVRATKEETEGDHHHD